MEVSREEMLEFAKQATFSLDDRLVPFDRETLRAEAWLLGYEMSKRFPLVSKDQQEMEMEIAALQCELKEVREELQKRDELIKVLRQKPEPEQVPDPVCGDMVIIYSSPLTGEVPVVAWWYGVNISEPLEPFYYFISIYGDKISYPANKIQIEKALPDYIADSVKRRLEAMIDADVTVASGNK